MHSTELIESETYVFISTLTLHSFAVMSNLPSRCHSYKATGVHSSGVTNHTSRGILVLTWLMNAHDCKRPGHTDFRKDLDWSS